MTCKVCLNIYNLYDSKSFVNINHSIQFHNPLIIVNSVLPKL